MVNLHMFYFTCTTNNNKRQHVIRYCIYIHIHVHILYIQYYNVKINFKMHFFLSLVSLFIYKVDVNKYVIMTLSFYFATSVYVLTVQSDNELVTFKVSGYYVQYIITYIHYTYMYSMLCAICTSSLYSIY